MRICSAVLIICVAAQTLFLFIPEAALAHLVTTGMGPVYDGIGHLLLTPEDLVPVLALAMFCGLRGARAGRILLCILPLSWLLGGMAGLGADLTFHFPVPALSFLLLGLLIAADLHLPAAASAGAAAVVGLVHGYLNGIALKAGPALPGVFGIMAALFVLAALVSATVVSLRTSWARTVVRVFGSWIAASGMLVIGWFVKGAG